MRSLGFRTDMPHGAVATFVWVPERWRVLWPPVCANLLLSPKYSFSFPKPPPFSICSSLSVMSPIESGVNIHTTPGLEPPPGVTSNLVNPYSIHRYLVATSAICLVISLSAVSARTFTKAYLLKNMQVEDCRFSLCAFNRIMADRFKTRWFSRL